MPVVCGVEAQARSLCCYTCWMLVSRPSNLILAISVSSISLDVDDVCMSLLTLTISLLWMSFVLSSSLLAEAR